MALHNNLILLFISAYLIVPLCIARAGLSPDVSPTLQPVSAPESTISLSPSPAAEAPLDDVSSPPLTSDAPSDSISLDTDAPPESDDPFKLFSFFKPPTSVDPKVDEICKSTDHPDLCMVTVAHFLKGNPDPDAILEVMISVGMKFAKFAHSLAKKLIETPGTPEDLRSVLKDCKGSYDDAVYNFENAQSAFPNRDIGTINSMLSAVITDVGDCEDAFAGMDTGSPLSSYAEKLTNMTSNCLAVASLVKN